MKKLEHVHKEENINFFKIIENKDKVIISIYEKFFKDLFSVKIFQKPFYSYFKNEKKNILLQTNIFEKNLYKNNKEIIDFLKIISLKLLIRRSESSKIRIFLLKKYNSNFLILKVFYHFFKSHYLLIKYFSYCFSFIFKNLMKINNKKYEY